MEKRRLGTIEVSPIGMGCMGLSHGYGDIPSEEIRYPYRAIAASKSSLTSKAA